MILYVYGNDFWSDKPVSDYLEVYKVELPKEIEAAYENNQLELVDGYVTKYLKQQNDEANRIIELLGKN